jgi:hypothetical protein
VYCVDCVLLKVVQQVFDDFVPWNPARTGQDHPVTSQSFGCKLCPITTIWSFSVEITNIFKILGP